MSSIMRNEVERASQQAGSARQPIAIVGMSGRFPGASSLAHFWRNVRDGVDTLETFTDAQMAAAGVDDALRARPDWVPRGTVLEGADLFDASFFGYSPREAQIIDPQHRVFLECAWEALEHAGYGAEPGGITVGVYAGVSLNTYVLTQLLTDRALVASAGGYQLMLGNDKDFLCTRVSYKLDLHGPSMTIQTACSTSLVAVQVACRALQRRECDMAMAGGVSLMFPERTGYQYQEGMIFSPDGTCRPFDVDARGTRAGAGAGVVVLKRLADALADRDTIHAVILGAAVNNDGSGKAGYTAPSVDGQVEAIAMAQALAGVSPRSISYIEAHGTGTPLGDPIEIAALTQVFRASTDEKAFCAIGSLKGNLGHLDAAAGVAGLIKTVLALEHAEIPPLVHFRSPNPQLQLPTSPFRVATSPEPWISTESPRRAGVSSFGIGGTNAHLVLEEAPAQAPTVTHRTHHLLVVSARTADALAVATTNLVEHLRTHPEVAIADVAHTLQSGRRVFQHRRSVVVGDSVSAADLLSRPERPPVLTGMHDGAARPVAFLFSGQGSQHAGMCRELYRDEAIFREALDRCAAHLKPQVGWDLRDVLRDGTDAAMSETSTAQPLLFATEYALATLWMSWGVRPAAMLGHSIGEYVAAHLAGVFSLEDALTLVAARGRLMQALAPGDMMAVSIAPDDLRPRLRPGAEIAAVNAPALCSVSGEPDAIAALARELLDAGIQHRKLHTSHAFHSAMMEPALAPFRDAVARVSLSAPRRRYVSNLTGTWIRPEQATSADYYVDHLRGAVQFADGMTTLAADPSVVLLEVGPGTVLTSLARQCLGREGAARVMSSLPHPRERRSETEAMISALGRLWTAGVSVDWTGLHAGEQLRRVPLPSYPFERKRFFVDAKAVSEKKAPAAELPERRASVAEWFHRPTWLRAAVPITRKAAISGTWLVFGLGDELSERVAARLRSLGANVIAVEPGVEFSTDDSARFTIRRGEQDDYIALLRNLRGQRLLPDGAVHLWNTGAASSVGRDGADSLRELLAFGAALIGETPSALMRLLVVTSGAQSVLDEPLIYPERALVAGPVLVLPQEHDGLQVRMVDVEVRSASNSTDHTAAGIVDEAAADDGETFVAHRVGLRWAKRFENAPLPVMDDTALKLRTNGVYLITGGLGGIGVTLAEWLAAHASARLLLTTRSPLPERETWDAWLAERSDDMVSAHIRSVRRIEAAGGEVLVATADASDLDAMRTAVQLARDRWGEMTGIIHAAGIKGDALMTLSTWAHVKTVLTPKVDGLGVLRTLFKDHVLDFVVLCSSVSAAVGFPGTCAYAAANAYLDAFVLSSQCPATWGAVSVAWDSWRDVGMATKLAAPRPTVVRDVVADGGILPHEGAETFACALSAGVPQHLVSPYDVQGFLEKRRRASSGTPRHAGRDAVVSAARAAAAVDVGGTPFRDVERKLAEVWMELLGVDTVGLDDDFFALGGHSLLATRVLARIDRDLGVRLPLRSVFEAPTIRQFAHVVTAEGAGVATVAEAAPAGDREEFEL